MLISLFLCDGLIENFEKFVQRHFMDARRPFHCERFGEIIRKASGETIDLKAFEADMRHLIDTYIEADEPRPISAFGDMPLLELIVKAGMASAVDSLPEGIKASKDAVAETIANNVRSKIIQEHLNNPAYYDRMSKLLEEIIAAVLAG